LTIIEKGDFKDFFTKRGEGDFSLPKHEFQVALALAGITVLFEFVLSAPH